MVTGSTRTLEYLVPSQTKAYKLDSIQVEIFVWDFSFFFRSKTNEKIMNVFLYNYIIHDRI